MVLLSSGADDAVDCVVCDDDEDDDEYCGVADVGGDIRCDDDDDDLDGVYQ